VKLYVEHGSASADQNRRYRDRERTSLGQQEYRRLTVRWTAADADIDLTRIGPTTGFRFLYAAVQ